DVDGARNDLLPRTPVVDDLLTTGADDQIMLDRREAEIIGQLFTAVHRLRRWRQNLHDDHGIGRGGRIGRQPGATIHHRVGLVVRVVIDFDGDAVAERLTIDARLSHGVVERGPYTVLYPDVLNSLRRHGHRFPG